MVLKKSLTISLFLALIVNSIACKNSTQEIVEEKSLEETQKKDIVIPFELTDYNNIKFKTVLNGTDTLYLKFDTGTTGLLLTHKAIKEKTRLLKNKKEKDTVTYNYVKLEALASIKVGPLQWDNLEVYPVQNSGQGTDGRFGWDLFDNKIISIDYDKSLFIVHDKLPDVTNYTKTQIKQLESIFGINGSIKINNQDYKSDFLFDTGYQRALLLDSVIVKEQSFIKGLSVIKTNQLRNGAGDIFITKVIEIPTLEISGQTINTFPAQLLNRENPSGMKVHILGNELLKRYNTIFDFKKKEMYLKRNSLFELPYVDAS